MKKNDKAFKLVEKTKDLPPIYTDVLVRLKRGLLNGNESFFAVAYLKEDGLWRLSYNDNLLDFVEAWYPLPE